MDKFFTSLAALIFIPLVFGHLHCGGGGEPETVIVPVGEPDTGEGDPYDAEGELGCGSDTGAAKATLVADEGGKKRVIVTFRGTRDIWVFDLSYSEYKNLLRRIQALWEPEFISRIDDEDVDAFHDDLCRSEEQLGREARRLNEILETVFGEEVEEMRSAACDGVDS